MTMNKNHLVIIVTSYKDKNLFEFVKELDKNTYTEHSIEVFEQHPIDHSKEFASIKSCAYDHKIWDDIAGMPIRKSEKIRNRLENSTHICVMTPDAEVTPGWDTKLIDILGEKNIVLSGNGKATVSQKDIFSLKAEYFSVEESVKNQFIDKTLMFSRSSAFKDIRPPDFLKYLGEDEYWALAFMSAGYDIYSIPKGVYKDLGYRSIENTYHTFSAEHNYNIVVGLLRGINLDDYKISRDAVNDFLSFHSINPENLKYLPYQTNDVSYDPYNLQMHDVDARRFVAGTKAVY